MWPWEHLAFAYLAYSLTLRATRGRSATDYEALLVAVTSQLPDLVDKPLAWAFDVLPSGLSLAHSLLFAVPTWVAAALIARHRGSPAAGAAVAVGYASHLVGDAVYPVVYGRPVRTAFLLWPVRSVPAEESSVGLIGNVVFYLDRTMALYATPHGKWFVAAEVALIGGALAVWVLDGAPGLRGVRRRVGDGVESG